MDENSLATEIDALCGEFVVPFRSLGDFKRQLFDKLLDKLNEYAELTQNDEEIDRRVADCLFLCYLAFQKYWDYADKAHPGSWRKVSAEKKLAKITVRILENKAS
jgi:hypothetical protein